MRATTFLREGDACLYTVLIYLYTVLILQCAKSHRTGLPFQQMKTETLESSAINDRRSMLAMFLTVLYKLEGIETETLM